VSWPPVLNKKGEFTNSRWQLADSMDSLTRDSALSSVEPRDVAVGWIVRDLQEKQQPVSFGSRWEERDHPTR
jgi:hypothetical protein